MNKDLKIMWNLLIAFWLPAVIFTITASSLYSYFTTVRDSAVKTAGLLEDMAVTCEKEGGEFTLEYSTEILYIWGECDYNLDGKFEYLLLPGEIYDDSL